MNNLNFNDPTCLKTLFTDSPIGVAFCDKKGGFIKANDAFCHIVGYTQAELSQRTYREITHPDDLAFDDSMIKALLDEEIDHYEMNKRYIHKMGGAVWIKLTVYSIWKDDGFGYFVAYVVPLINGERLKAQYNAKNKVTIRPTISLLEFWRDNWKTLIPLVFVLLSGVIVGYGRLEARNDAQDISISEIKTELKIELKNLNESLKEIKDILKSGS